MIEDLEITIPSLWDCEREAFRPPDKLSVSEWANRHIVLLKESSREAGPYRWQRTPYARDVMDLYQRPSIRHIVLKWATQTSKTQSAYNLIGYIIDQDPYSTLIVYPSDDACKHISRTRVQPMIEAVDVLREKIPADRTKYQLQEMHFPGMILSLGSGSGVTSVAQKSVRNLIRDEVNKFPPTIGEHGDPMELSEERLKTYWDIRKIIDVSSPTTADGQITAEEGKCQVVLSYYVPCPHCLGLQVLEFSRSKLDGDADQGKDPERRGQVVFENRRDLPRTERIAHAKKTSTYVCKHCGREIPDKYKDWILSPENGAGWYRTGTEEPAASADPIGDLFREFEEAGVRLESVALRLSSLYSPWLTWGDVTEAFLKAHLAEEKRFDKLRRFENDWLGREYSTVVAEKTESQILKLKGELPPLIVPPEAIALTAGIDNQKRGKYFTVWAWGRDETRWLIHYGILFSWEDVYHLIYRNAYQVEGTERQVNIWRAALDTGGGDLDDQDATMTQEAYEWLSRFGGNVVYGYKGSSRPMAEKMRANIIGTFPGSKKPIPGAGVKLWIVDPGYFKDLFHSHLELAAGAPGCVYLHNETGEDFASHITSEEKRRGPKGAKWEHVRGENHYLDSSIMASFLVDPMCLGGIRVLVPQIPPAAAAATPALGGEQPGAQAARGGRRRYW